MREQRPFRNRVRVRVRSFETCFKALVSNSSRRSPVLDRELQLHLVKAMNRRAFLWTGALGASAAARKPANSETVYRFRAGDCDIRMAVEFFDNYSTNGFWFKEQRDNRRFCLSGAGRENRDCLANFTGSIAIARYHIQPLSHAPRTLALREHVRAIDQDSRLVTREPFERTINLENGVASDIQAFGYQADASSPSQESGGGNGPWCLLRQDLYLDGQDALFLVLHWKHTLNAIRLFDVIPGDRTDLVAESAAPPRTSR
ncbi:MAG TPA: hypothetical protein VHU83_07880 [Bryobacteraceae bacterium]|jgi:hypothetical protein|nr:hypothetical protein [Bryobacteraceae bacterium]